MSSGSPVRNKAIQVSSSVTTFLVDDLWWVFGVLHIPQLTSYLKIRNILSSKEASNLVGQKHSKNIYKFQNRLDREE